MIWQRERERETDRQTDRTTEPQRNPCFLHKPLKINKFLTPSLAKIFEKFTFTARYPAIWLLQKKTWARPLTDLPSFIPGPRGKCQEGNNCLWSFCTLSLRFLFGSSLSFMPTVCSCLPTHVFSGQKVLYFCFLTHLNPKWKVRVFSDKQPENTALWIYGGSCTQKCTFHVKATLSASFEAKSLENISIYETHTWKHHCCKWK